MNPVAGRAANVRARLPPAKESAPPNAEARGLFVKTVFVQDLPQHVNEVVTTFFLVRARETRFKKSGEPYLSLILSDRTGHVEARFWDNLETVPAFDRDDYVKVRGLVQVFRDKPQLALHKLRRLDEGDVEPGDYFARAPRDSEEMFGELCEVVAQVRRPELRGLLRAVVSDRQIAARLKCAPAAKSLHHAYLGGLLEHILSLCALSRRVAGQYPALDTDLLIAAAVLHDIGKIYELDYRRSVSYTTEGHLLGHITIGLDIIREKVAAMPEFPPALRVLLEHLIISHHGEYEFGSPKLPMFAEALVFHYLDDLDSKMNSLAGQAAADVSMDGVWTSRNPSLGRAFLKLDQYLKPGEAGPPGNGSAGAAGSPAEPALPGETATEGAAGDAPAGEGHHA